MPAPHGAQPEQAASVGAETIGTSKRDAPMSFKNIGNPEKTKPF